MGDVYIIVVLTFLDVGVGFLLTYLINKKTQRGCMYTYCSAVKDEISFTLIYKLSIRYY
jgi:hypothetical protein